MVNLMWAAQYPAYKVASDAMSIAALNAYTFAIASLAILPFVLRQRRRTGAARLDRSAIGRFLLLAALGVIPPSVVASWGIANSTASNGAILSLAIPIMMTLMGVALLGERPPRTLLISLVLALGGTILISWKDIASGSFTGPMLLGNIAILAGGAGSAFFNAYGKRVLERFTGIETLFFTNVIAFVFCAALSMLVGARPFYDAPAASAAAWIGVAVLGVFSWGVGMVIWLWLLKQLEVSQVAVTVYMLPVLGVLLSVVTLGEALSIMQALGALVVLASAYFSAGPAPVAGQPPADSAPGTPGHAHEQRVAVSRPL